jgi:hypothetical protein
MLARPVAMMQLDVNVNAIDQETCTKEEAEQKISDRLKFR